MGFGNCPGTPELKGSYALTNNFTESLKYLYIMCFEWKQDVQMPCIALAIYTYIPIAIVMYQCRHLSCCRLSTTSKQSVKIYSSVTPWTMCTISNFIYLWSVLGGGGPSCDLDWIQYSYIICKPQLEKWGWRLLNTIFPVNHNDRSTSPDTSDTFWEQSGVFSTLYLFFFFYLHRKV